MMVMSNYAISGDVVERQFYIMIWDKYQENAERDILKETIEFVGKFESENIRCEILIEQEIVGLCNLVNNPAYVGVEEEIKKRYFVDERILGKFV
jgi:hypothetical protein